MEAFKFKQFSLEHDKSAMKVGTDGVLLGAWASVENSLRVLDIGTGSGVIALMLGQRNRTAEICGIEIDGASAEEATSNASASPFSSQLQIIHTSLQEFDISSSQKKFDLIVCNPPFFTGGTLTQNTNRDVARHTKKLSHNDLLQGVKRLLAKDSGKFSVILPYIEGLQFIEIAKSYGLYLSKMTEVKPKADKKIERLLIEFNTMPSNEVLTNELIIQHNERNDYTLDYIELTKDFYLNM